MLRMKQQQQKLDQFLSGNIVRDWNTLESVLLVLQFVLALAVLVLNCFADRTPDYMDIKGTCTEEDS